jgi:predicted Zn-dependent protease
MKKKKPTKPIAVRPDEPTKSMALSGTSSFSGKHLGSLIAAFALMLYIQSVSFGYVLDDQATLHGNRFVTQGLEGIPTLIKTDYWFGSDVGVRVPLYRPGSYVLFATIWEIFPDSPAVFHLVNVLMFAISCWLLYLLLTRLMAGKNALFPLICTVLYAAHPIHTEVVNNIKSADEILCFLFAILTSLSALTYVQKRSPLHLFLTGFFYFIAVFSKESGVVFIVVIPLMLYYFTDTKPKQTLPVFSILAIIGAIFFMARANVLADVPDYDQTSIVNVLYTAPDFITQRATALFLLLKYELLLLFPHPLTYNYDFAQIALKEITHPLVIISLLFHAGIALYAFIGIKTKSILSFAILFYLVTISPVSNIFLIIGTSFAERLLYIPSLGFCMALTYLLIKLSKAESFTLPKLNVKKLISAHPVLLSVVVITALYAVKTITRNPDWKDNVALFGHDLKYSEQSTTAHYHWGNALLSNLYEQETDSMKRSQYVDQAITAYQRAIEIYPQYAAAYLHLGDAYSKKNKAADAIPYFVEYNKFMNNSNPVALKYLGGLYDKTGQFDLALQTYKTLISVHTAPDPETLYFIGLLYNKKQDYVQAIPYLDSCLQFTPDYLPALKHKAIAHVNLKQNEEAIATCERILKLDPNYVKAYTYLGFAYSNMLNYPKAIEYLEKALALAPGDAESQNMVNVLYGMVGKSK